MTPRIENVSEKILVGKRIKMSLIENQTADLWRSFMSSRNEITNRVGSDLISMQVYDDNYFNQFSPANEFEKWAAVEVSSFAGNNGQFEKFILPSGLYAIFHYKGLAGNPAIFQYILTDWLPRSAYVLDNRPHFEVLGSKYRNNDPDSEELIYVPIKLK